MNKKIIIGLLIVLLLFVSFNAVMAESDDDFNETLSDADLNSDLLSLEENSTLNRDLLSLEDDSTLNQADKAAGDEEVLASSNLEGTISNSGSVDNLDNVNDDLELTGDAQEDDSVIEAISSRALLGLADIDFVSSSTSDAVFSSSDDAVSSSGSDEVLTISGSDAVSSSGLNVLASSSDGAVLASSSATAVSASKNTYYIAAGATNKQIQSIIDSAPSGSTIQFNGTSYTDLCLIIKKSLNIISKVGTSITSSLDKAVFSISTSNAKNTNISGFTIKNTGSGDGIRIANASNIGISKNTITTNSIGIRAVSADNLDIRNNKLADNPSAISLALTSYAYVFKNTISGGNYGITISKSYGTSIENNTISKTGKAGIYAAKTINNVYYGEGPQHLYIRYNTISNNYGDGIDLENVKSDLYIFRNSICNNGNHGINLENVGEGINITRNTISSNSNNGIRLNKVGSNTIQSNTIEKNRIGINFGQDYVHPSKQDISYNAVYGNTHREVEAMETSYDFTNQLGIGDNWYGGSPNICPKINSGLITFKVRQVSTYYFEVTFYDSKGNVASLLPSRTVSHKVGNGISRTDTISNGQGLVDRDASDNDILSFMIDGGVQTVKYKSQDSSYRDIQVDNYGGKAKNIDDIGKTWEEIKKELEAASGGNGTGSGSGNSNGNGGNNGNNGNSNGNGTAVNNGNNGDSNGVSTSSTNPLGSSSSSGLGSSAGASSSGAPATDSTVMRTLEVDDEEFRVVGVWWLLLLIIIVIGLYYREDIEDMIRKTYY